MYEITAGYIVKSMLLGFQVFYSESTVIGGKYQ